MEEIVTSAGITVSQVHHGYDLAGTSRPENDSGWRTAAVSMAYTPTPSPKYNPLIRKSFANRHLFGSPQDMLNIFFKTAWRNIVRGKLYSILNLLGLAIGMAVALLIGLWVTYQLSYDRFVPDYGQAFQVRFNYNDNGVIRNQAEVCLPLANAIRKDIPEAAHVAQAFDIGRAMFTVKDKHIYGDAVYAGEDFLRVFSFPLVAGDPATALQGQTPSIVITEAMAKSLFGSTDALNQTVDFGVGNPLKVTAVVRDLPRNSSFRFDFLLPFSDFAKNDWIKAAMTRWDYAYYQLYVSLRPGADAARAEAKARQLVRQYAPESYATFHREPMFFPLKDWHLYTTFKDGQPEGGLIDYVRMFSLVGILVLLIACINFMNLSTARSEKRAREVGVRKVMGSLRGQLILQFLLESLLMTALAFLISLALVQTALPAFNALTGDAVRVPYGSGWFWFTMVSFVLLTGLLAGSPPAIFLSSFQPVKVLKRATNIGPAASLARKVLVVLQFTCSIALIIGTIIVYQQIQYAKDRPKGYDPNRLVVSRVFTDAYPAFKQAMLASGVVSNMTTSAVPQTDIESRNTIDNWPGKQPNEPLAIAVNAVGDPGYFRTLGIGFVAGNDFAGSDAADSSCIIINEAAARLMRLKQPLNQYLGLSFINATHRLRIIGVVKDALTANPFGAAQPAAFIFQPSWAWILSMRLAPTVSTSTALARMKTIYEKYNPGYPFDYSFVDQSYASKFATEMLIGRLAGIFAALAIFISCLGLFGLTAYMAEQRTREIGIRKVLGASVNQVLLLLSGDFIVLVAISCLIATPVAYYFLHRWLAGYNYRITISPVVFVLAAAAALVTTALTVGFQSVKSALMNPVRSLRNE